MEEMLQKIINQMNENFKIIDEKFDEINKKFDKINEKFDKIDEKFDKIDEKFDKIDEKFDKIDKRFDEFDQKLEDTRKEILDRQFLFEQEYGAKIDIILDAVKMQLDKNVEKAEQIRQLDDRVDKIEMNLFSHEARLDRLEMSKNSLIS